MSRLRIFSFKKKIESTTKISEENKIYNTQELQVYKLLNIADKYYTKKMGFQSTATSNQRKKAD